MIFPFKRKAISKDATPEAHPKKRSGRSSGIAIFWLDEKWAKIVFAKGKPGRWYIESLVSVAFEGKEDDAVLEVLRSTVAEQKAEGRSVFVVHPAHLSRSRLLRLPSTDSKELAGMIELQVEKHTPDSKEDTLTYYKLIQSDAEGYSDVFLVMTHQDRVSRAVRMAQRLFSGLQGVASDIDGLAQWMNSQGKREEGGTVLIDFDMDYATVLVVHGGEVCFHRSIAIRNEVMMAHPEGLEAQQFLDELHRSIMAYDEESRKGACARVHLIGDFAVLEGLTAQMKKELSLPVTIFPAQAGFAMSPQVVDQIRQFPGVSFAGLFGLLCAGKPGDLTPVSVKMRRLFQQKVRTASVLAGQILFGVMLVFGFFFYGVRQDMKYIAYLEAQDIQIQAPARELETSIEHLKIVRRRIEKRGILLEAMTAIAKVTSPAIRWTGLTYDENEGIVVKGISDDMANVFEMVAELEKSDFFAKPEARRVSKRKVDGQDVTDFEIVLPLAGTEAETDETA